MTKKIPLSGTPGKGKFVLVDDEDYEWAKDWTWFFHYSPKRPEYGYAATRMTDSGSPKLVFMHKAILGFPKNKKGDHINGDRLDNRRANLRKATSLQNSHNKRKESRNRSTSSQYKGVYFESRRSRWIARITIDGKQKYLKSFKSEEDAARHYDAIAIEAFGEYAWPNFPQQDFRRL